MKLKLRIGRQREQGAETDEVRNGGVATTPRMPLPRTPMQADRRVVRAGSFCRVSDIGQSAATDTGRAVVAIRSGRCGRWVYADQA